MKTPYKKELTAKKLAALSDHEIDTSDIPELGKEFWKNARVVRPEDRHKTQITAKFDTEVVRWFKKQGRGYQAHMNAVLRTYYDAHRKPR